MIDKVSQALGEWGFKVAASVLPKYRIPQGSTIANIMQGFFGTDPASYNVWNELGFLAEPLIQNAVSPMVSRMLAGVPEEQIPDLVGKYIDAFIKQAKEKEYVNLFGVHLGADAFEGLATIMAERLKEDK